MLPMLRILIVIIAALELFWFSGAYAISFEMLAPPWNAHWYDYLFAVGNGIVVPLCALAAGVLAILGKRLGLAAILLVVAAIVYILPGLSSVIAVMIYGF